MSFVGVHGVGDRDAALHIPSLLDGEAHGTFDLSSYDTDASRSGHQHLRPVPSTPLIQPSSPRPASLESCRPINHRIACRPPYHSEFLSEIQETVDDGGNTRGNNSIDVAASPPHDGSVKSLDPRPGDVPTGERPASRDPCLELTVEERTKDDAITPSLSLDCFDGHFIITDEGRTSDGRWICEVISAKTFADVVRETRRSENAPPPCRHFSSFHVCCQTSASSHHVTKVDPLDNGPRRYSSTGVKIEHPFREDLKNKDSREHIHMNNG